MQVIEFAISHEEIVDIFKVLDRDGSGKICLEELANFVDWFFYIFIAVFGMLVWASNDRKRSNSNSSAGSVGKTSSEKLKPISTSPISHQQLNYS